MNIIKRPIFIIIVAIVASAVIGVYAFLRIRSSSSGFENIAEVQKMTLSQEVEAGGKVKPGESVALSFEKGGKVSGIYVKSGDKVYKGETLVALGNADLRVQELQAEAGLEMEEARLEELKKGSLPEEIQAAQTNLQNAQAKAQADLDGVYSKALTTLQGAADSGKSAILTVTDIQYAHFSANDQTGQKIADAKEAAVKYMLGADDAGRWTSDPLSKLEGGAFGAVKAAAENPLYSSVDLALSETLFALKKVKQALDSVPVTGDLTSAESANLSVQSAGINASITAVSGAIQSISSQKVANENAISTAEDSLTLKKVGATSEQIKEQEARVKSAQAGIDGVRVQIAKTIISAPFAGVVSVSDLSVGEAVPPNTPIVSLISDAKFEVESFISEADIAKIKVGDKAEITLDTYSRGQIFDAEVISIDPAETVVDGVNAYKIILQFENEDDRIKSGMTANVAVATAIHKDALAVPAGAIITRGNEKFVLVDTSGSSPVEKKVETGIKGKSGYVEILTGLSLGEKIINFGSIR